MLIESQTNTNQMKVPLNTLDSEERTRGEAVRGR